MKTEQVIQRLANEAESPTGEYVFLKKEDARMVLERVKHLEGIAAALLRSQREGKSEIVIPYRPAP